MKVQEIDKLIGKMVTFSSDTTRRYVHSTSTGMVEERVRFEVLIEGDWHNVRTLKIKEVHEG